MNIEEQYPGPPEFIMYPTIPIDPPELPKSRRYIEIYISDGIRRKLLACQDLPDALPSDVCVLTFDDKVLDLAIICKQVPDHFHLAIHNYLGTISQADYNNNISEIIIEWAS